ncbi:hypothetical protein CB0940_08855 [Cercospora beticola]|uniref:Uncharacterized protein n=1 Tax=Cercospora beticola TaxID=122368 RepID=A0A2G5HNU8_CERBT|nr:hypothetical protein CB0940_08855 [Cercospora beticola]PIA94226.1 hypothetical protein CB0940_08855 [Cercospora beticola]WPB05447.1 hypothetical protein RHO25_010099 [Cercospora beticola]CAK1365257.1 unnamed protein product [Cercospora beticola]
MGPTALPTKLAILDAFASLADEDVYRDYLPIERDETGLNRGRIAEIMSNYAFHANVGGQDREFNEKEFGELMRLVYEEKLYERIAKLNAAVKKVQGTWDALKTLSASPESSLVEQTFTKQLHSAEAKGLRAETPVSLSDTAMGEKLLKNIVTLREKAEKVVKEAKTDAITGAIDAVKRIVMHTAFEMLELYMLKAEEKYAEYFTALMALIVQEKKQGSILPAGDVVGSARQERNRREAALVDFGKFYRRVRNVQTHALLTIDLAQGINDWLKSSPSVLAGKIAMSLLDVQGNIMSGELSEARKIYIEDLKPALQIESQAPVQKLLDMRMPLDVYTFGDNVVITVASPVRGIGLPNCAPVHGICELNATPSGAASSIESQVTKGDDGVYTLRALAEPEDEEVTGAVAFFNLPQPLRDSGDVKYGYHNVKAGDRGARISYNKPFAEGVTPKVFAWLVKGYFKKAGEGTTCSVSASTPEVHPHEVLQLKVEKPEGVVAQIGWMAIHPKRTDLIGQVVTVKVPDAMDKGGVAKNDELQTKWMLTFPNSPKRKMRLVTTFISGYESKDRVQARTALQTLSNAFVDLETRASITFTTFAYLPPEDQKVILPSWG